MENFVTVALRLKRECSFREAKERREERRDGGGNAADRADGSDFFDGRV